MYYRIVKQKVSIGPTKRNIITVANREFFADLKDESPMGYPPVITMDEDVFEQILKDGYPTKEEAINDKEMVQVLEDYIGPFFYTEHTIVDEKELKEIYKATKD